MYLDSKKHILSLFGALAMLAAMTTSAGECRGLLRPLLLQQTPDDNNLAAIREICQTEADAGDPDSEYQLSLFYLGLIEWNVDKAVPLIVNSAQSGVSEAQYWLAWQYDAGPLLRDDLGLALRWYEMAGENDHRLALQRLAEAYQRGELGLPVDARKASLLRARASKCENNSG